MVKDWETPPEWNVNLALAALSFQTSPAWKQFVRKAHSEYWPWHVLRHKVIPDGITSESAWLGLKLIRLTQTRDIPLLDSTGRHFGFWIPDKAQEYLPFIDRHLGCVLGAANTDVFKANRERYLVSSLMEEAIASSQIEGAGTTRRVAKEMLRTGRAPRDRSERMILNNYRTVHRIKELSGEPLTLELLLLLHESMTEGTLESPEMCGRFRKSEEQVRVVDLADGDILHVPPPASELAGRVQRLCDFANADTDEEFIHPVVRAILLHFWLAYDHPFVDGNGRTARALFYWYLLSKGYWITEFLSISRVILGAPQQYSRAFLWSERDDCDATYFVMFHLRKVCEAVEALHDYLSAQEKKLREGLVVLEKAEGLNYRQRALIQHALRHPQGTYTFKSHRNCHGVAYATARADLLDMAHRGLLRTTKVGRQFVFTPALNIAQRVGADS